MRHEVPQPGPLFPVRKSLVEWELLAAPMQAHLKANVKTVEPVIYELSIPIN